MLEDILEVVVDLIWMYYIKKIFGIRVIILFLYSVIFFFIDFWLVFGGIFYILFYFVLN